MRAAQVDVMPGILSSSSMLAWLMSMRAAGGGAGLDFGATCGAEELCPAAQAMDRDAAARRIVANAASRVNPAGVGTDPFSASWCGGGKKRI